jgi:malonyl-CoA O-methyltransferase
LHSKKEQIKKQFNHAKNTYDQHAIVQQEMAKQLSNLLPKDDQIKNILEIGCGTGLFTKLLLKQYPTASLLAVDLADEMIEKAKQQLTSLSQVQLRVADIEELDLSTLPPFDLIVSNAVIQWLQSKQTTLQRLIASLKPKGWFLASTFGPKTFHELQTAFQQVEQQLQLPPTHHLLPLCSEMEWRQLLRHAGLQRITSKQSFHRLYYANCLTFLKGIKKVGANYQNELLPFHQRRKLLKRVIHQYDQQYLTPKGVYTTYEVLYLIGQKESSCQKI